MSKKDLVAEHRELCIQHAVHNRVAALMKQRMDEIEAELFPAVKKVNAMVVGKVIIRYNRTTSTTYSYSHLWREAVRLAEPEMKVTLEGIKTDNARNNVQESLEFIDADYTTTTKGITKLSLEELIATACLPI